MVTSWLRKFKERYLVLVWLVSPKIMTSQTRTLQKALKDSLKELDSTQMRLLITSPHKDGEPMDRTALADYSGRFCLLDYRFVQGEGKKGYQTFIYHDPCLSSLEVRDLNEAITFMTGHLCEDHAYVIH